MIITVASYKGGVGKTTTALHLAAFFQRLAPTLLVDGDAIRTSIKWSQRGAGNGLPFKVVDEKQTAIATRDGHFAKAAICSSFPPCPRRWRPTG